MPVTGDRDALLEDVYAAMVALEQPVLSAIDTTFHAYEYMPLATPTVPLQYPCTFRVTWSGGPTDRTMGNGKDTANVPTDIEVWLFYLVGLSSQPFGALAKLADKGIRPLQELYIAHRTIGGTVGNLTFGLFEQGDYEFNSVKHYGLKWPITIHQRQHMLNAQNG